MKKIPKLSWVGNSHDSNNLSPRRVNPKIFRNILADVFVYFNCLEKVKSRCEKWVETIREEEERLDGETNSVDTDVIDDFLGNFDLQVKKKKLSLTNVIRLSYEILDLLDELIDRTGPILKKTLKREDILKLMKDVKKSSTQMESFLFENIEKDQSKDNGRSTLMVVERTSELTHQVLKITKIRRLTKFNVDMFILSSKLDNLLRKLKSNVNEHCNELWKNEVKHVESLEYLSIPSVESFDSMFKSVSGNLV